MNCEAQDRKSTSKFWVTLSPCGGTWKYHYADVESHTEVKLDSGAGFMLFLDGSESKPLDFSGSPLDFKDDTNQHP